MYKHTYVQLIISFEALIRSIVRSETVIRHPSTFYNDNGYTVLVAGKVFPAFKCFGDFAVMYVNVFYFSDGRHRRKTQTQLLGKAYKVQCSLACCLPSWLQWPHSYVVMYIETYVVMPLFVHKHVYA